MENWQEGWNWNRLAGAQGTCTKGLSYDRCGRMFRQAPREAFPLVMSMRLKLGLLAICSLVAMSGTCHAQNSANIPSAVVKADSLAVYPDMNTSGRIVLSLEKGDEVVIDFEIKATENWCGVRQPLQTSRLGYVQCQGLERIERHSDSLPHASGAPIGADISKQSGHNISLPPPTAGSINGYNQIAELAVREGSIDAAKMAEFDAAARDGSSSGMSRAALAHFAAGKFELSRNSVDEAIEQFQFSLHFSAGRTDLQLANLLSLAYIDLVQSKYSAALEYLERAPLSAEVSGCGPAVGLGILRPEPDGRGHQRVGDRAEYPAFATIDDHDREGRARQGS